MKIIESDLHKSIENYMLSNPELLQNAVDNAIEERIKTKKNLLNQELEIGLQQAEKGELVSANEAEFKMQKLRNEFNG